MCVVERKVVPCYDMLDNMLCRSVLRRSVLRQFVLRRLELRRFVLRRFVLHRACRGVIMIVSNLTTCNRYATICALYAHL